jgi:hypothetical protein
MKAKLIAVTQRSYGVELKYETAEAEEISERFRDSWGWEMPVAGEVSR